MRRSQPVEAHHFEALGTSCSLFGVGVTRTQLLQGEFWVRALGMRITRFSDRSELALLNDAEGEWVRVSAEMEAVLREALSAYELSAGLVNAAVLPSMLAIGYTRSLASGASSPQLENARPAPPLDEVLFLRPGLARLRAGCGLDLGGIAKGWMADRLAARLGSNALANLGGDLMAIGPGPNGDGWPVGFGGVTVMLRDQGAATSSVRRRRWGDLHHLIDPRTGLPSQSGLEEVSVVAATGCRSEVVAKTALLLGPGLATAYCAAHAQAWWLS
ncbi:MAG TPA: FAD:protein FMN transferase [Candidatus Dormibacteraeota bacterium]